MKVEHRERVRKDLWRGQREKEKLRRDSSLQVLRKQTPEEREQNRALGAGRTLQEEENRRLELLEERNFQAQV